MNGPKSESSKMRKARLFGFVGLLLLVMLAFGTWMSRDEAVTIEVPAVVGDSIP